MYTKEQQKEYRLKNLDKYRDYSKSYRKKYPELIKEADKKWRKNNPDKVRAHKRTWLKHRTLTKLQILKIEARKIVREALKKGLLNKENCSICGFVKTDAHHDDYDKPLEVIWLCRKHHLEKHHKKASA